MSYNFVPHGNFIATQLVEQESTTPGGIILPDQAKEKPQLAKVLAVGPGLRSMMTDDLIPIPLEEGQLIFVNKFSPQVIELPGGAKIALIQYGDVLGTLEKAEEGD